MNTTTDKELKEAFHEALQIAKSHQEHLTTFMKQEGVPMSEPSETKPLSDANSIPMGAKFTDDELSNALAVNIVTATSMCAAVAGESIRNDVGAMFLKFQLQKITLGAKLKALMKKRGWLNIPPAYIPPGKPTQPN